MDRILQSSSSEVGVGVDVDVGVDQAQPQTPMVVDGAAAFPLIDPTEISTLNDTQEMILSLLPIIPSLLSVIGSATIISMVLSSYKRKPSSITPYKRLLLGMSCCDVLWSITIPTWAFLVPQSTSQRVWAFGNDTTCNIIGTFGQWGFSGILYNGMLTVYFLLTVRYGYKDRDMTMSSKRCCCCSVEFIMHFISIGYPLLTAIIGLCLDVYDESELGLNCWVGNYPKNCGPDLVYGESGEQCYGVYIAYIFGGVVIFPTMIIVIINNILIYKFVRNTITTSRRRSSVVSIEFQQTQSQSQQQQRNGESNGGNGRRRTGTTTVAQQHDNQTRRIQAVATQGFLYVTAFVTSYIWTLIIKIMEGSSYDAQDEASIFWLLCFQATFMPFQGFFNLLIYVRPNYIRLRNDYPYETKLWAVRRTLYGDSVEPRQHSRPTTNTNNSADGPNTGQDGGVGGGDGGTNSGDSLVFVGKATRLSHTLGRSSKDEEQEQEQSLRFFQLLFPWRRIRKENDSSSNQIVSIQDAKEENELSDETSGGYSSNNNNDNSSNDAKGFL